MPAITSDIAAASREVSIASWSSATNRDRYPSARDGSVTPASGYCDSQTDAQAVVDARGGLIGVERRRFAVDVHDLVWPTIEDGVPQAALVDDEQRVNGGFLAARIEIDLEAETTAYELFG